MQNIILRKIQKEDLKDIGRCFAHKIVPIRKSFSEKNSLTDYLNRDMKSELALVIEEKKNNIFLGIIEGIKIDDVMLISYFITPNYQNMGVATTAVYLFIEYIRANNPDIKQIRASMLNSNFASIKVVRRNGFKLANINEFAQDWNYNL